jgi:HAD superfamily hydrolase (TIGR01490 family)
MLKHIGKVTIHNSNNAEDNSLRAAFFDIDGTLTSERTWKGILDYFQRRGERRGTHLLYMAVHYPLYFMRRLRLISESDFRAPWAAHLAWYVRGYTVQQADDLWDWAIDKFISQYWRTDTRALLEAHCESGDLVMLVSSGPLPLVQRAALQLGVDHAVGTRFEIQAGLYTGRSLDPVCIDAYKASLPLDYLRTRGLKVDLEASYAYADSLADLPMLEMVGHPTAVYPDPGLQKIAAQRRWRIIPPSLGASSVQNDKVNEY